MESETMLTRIAETFLMAVIIAAMIVFFFACAGGSSGPAPYTWGDASDELAVSYCDAHVRCGWSSDWERCRSHNVHHLCELDDVCAIELEPGAEDIVAECSAALNDIDDSHECVDLLYVLPDSCYELLELKPTE